MEIKVSMYKANLYGKQSVWAGYQVDLLVDGKIPEKESYIVQYYGEDTDKLERHNIYGGQYKFNNMVQQKLDKGFYHAGHCYLDTDTGVFKEVA